MTPAQAKKERADLWKQIKREEKKSNRARVLELRAKVRQLRAERSRAIARARAACKRRRSGVPTLKQAAAMLRAARAEARATCDGELAAAKVLKTAEARARAERDAEKKHQATMRRLERQGKARESERRPTLARTRVSESDDEVRGNIPPELVALFERVKRQIRGSDRMTRTEAFLQYAHEHPDEEIQALEDKTDEMIRQYERRANKPRKLDVARCKTSARHAKKAGRKLPPCARDLPRRNAKKGAKQTGAQRDLFMPATGQLEIVPSYEQREAVKRQKESAEKRTIPMFGNPRQPPGAWWDDCIAAVKRTGRVREPRAVCGAAWWNLAPARRAAIVRKLERSPDRRARGAALALARAEKKHHAKHGGPARALRRSNPRELVSLVYLEKKKGDRVPYEYEHDFEGERPILEMRGGKAQIRGGTYTARRGWLHG
jgi:hypothetical protein